MAQFDSLDEVVLFARDLVDIDAPVEALAEFVSDLARMEVVEEPDPIHCTCEQNFGACYDCQVAFAQDTQGSDRGPVPMYYQEMRRNG